MRTVTFIPLALLLPCKWSPSQPPVFALGCVIEELSFINDYITNTNQTKELLFFFSFCWLKHRSSAGHQRQQWKSIHVKDQKASDKFSDQHVRAEERVNMFNLHACIHCQKLQGNWHAVIKLCQNLFLVLMHETSLTWRSHEIMPFDPGVTVLFR